MKKLLVIVSLFLSFQILLPSQEAKAQMDPRITALGSMAVYGATGGLLLGTAALAFDAPGRSPFIGASLGLYAGIIFGTYIVVTHAIKKHRLENPGAGDEEYYPETPDSPYESPFSGGGYDDPQGGGQYKIDPTVIESPTRSLGPDWSRGRTNVPLFYVNILKMTF